MFRVRWQVATIAILGICMAIDLCCAMSVYQTALVFAISSSDAEGATAVLDGYGAPYDLIMVPQSGIELPTLETTTECNEPVGLYGLIVVVSQLSYDYGGSIGYASALNSSQWDTLYAYQVKYSVRMVQLNIYPSAVEGVGVVPPGGCCSGEEQLITLTDTSFIPSAGLNSVGLSTIGLWHTPAVVTDSNTTATSAFLEFGTNSQYSSTSVAGVKKIYSDGREEMDFFITVGSWSPTSNYLGHIWFTWGYRGLYGGYRRIYFSTQGIKVLHLRSF